MTPSWPTPDSVGCEKGKACVPCDTVAGQEGWKNLHPFHMEVLAFYPEGKRDAMAMLALWQATMDLWNKKIAPAWFDKAYGMKGDAELRRIADELSEWKSRMNSYQISLQANTRATDVQIRPSVTLGLLLDSPTTMVPVPDFLFPLYLENQLNVLEAAHIENRKYFRGQLIEQTRRVRDAIAAVPIAAGRALLGDLLLPLLVSVAGGVTVYLITTRRQKNAR